MRATSTSTKTIVRQQPSLKRHVQFALAALALAVAGLSAAAAVIPPAAALASDSDMDWCTNC